MLFNADIRQNCTLEEVNPEQQKISKRNSHQKVEKMKQKLTLILDEVNPLSNNRAQKSRYPEIRTSQMTRLEWLLVTSAAIIISIIVIVIISIGFNDVTLTVIER